MSNVPTPHNAAKEGEIAKTVLMPGDSLRAKLTAETYPENVTCFSTVRNMPGLTGTYKGHPVSVMGGDMDMPSVGIYTYELFNFCGVENIIRIGPAGGLANTVRLRDVIAEMGTCTNSSSVEQYRLPGVYVPITDCGLSNRAVKAVEKLGIPMKVGNVLSSGTFYGDNENVPPAWKRMGVLAVEMEAAASCMNAVHAGKNALCLLTISDCPLTGESLPAKERQTGFIQMMEVALALA